MLSYELEILYFTDNWIGLNWNNQESITKDFKVSI